MPNEKLVTAVSKSYPEASEILVSFPEHWELVQRIDQRMTKRVSPLYIAAMPPELERPRRDHFAGLPREINLSLDSYRLYRFFQPWPMPTILVHWNPYLASGRVVGQKEMKLQLQDIGDAQTWTGPEFGVLWECFLHSRGRDLPDWRDTLAQLWQVVEQSMGVRMIYTAPHEPTFEEGYTDFLSQLGYAQDERYPLWWSKTLSV